MWHLSLMLLNVDHCLCSIISLLKSRQKTESLWNRHKRLHGAQSSEQMHPYVAKVRTVGFSDQTDQLTSPLSVSSSRCLDC